MIRTEFPSMLFNIAVCLHGKWDYRECVHGNISSADHCPLFPETGPQGPSPNDIWRKNYLSLYGGCILYEVGVFSSIIVSLMSEILNNTNLFNYCVHHHQIILSIVVTVMFNLLIIRCPRLLSSRVLASLETTSPCKTLLLLTATMPSNKNAAAASEIAGANKNLMAMISRKRAQNLNQGF